MNQVSEFSSGTCLTFTPLFRTPLLSGKRTIADLEHSNSEGMLANEEGVLLLGYARTSEGWGLAVKEVVTGELWNEGPRTATGLTLGPTSF